MFNIYGLVLSKAPLTYTQSESENMGILLYTQVLFTILLDSLINILFLQYSSRIINKFIKFWSFIAVAKFWQKLDSTKLCYRDNYIKKGILFSYFKISILFIFPSLFFLSHPFFFSSLLSPVPPSSFYFSSFSFFLDPLLLPLFFLFPCSLPPPLFIPFPLSHFPLFLPPPLLFFFSQHLVPSPPFSFSSFSYLLSLIPILLLPLPFLFPPYIIPPFLLLFLFLSSPSYLFLFFTPLFLFSSPSPSHPSSFSLPLPLSLPKNYCQGLMLYSRSKLHFKSVGFI